MSSSPDLGKSRVATVFVDNLPKDVWKVWLYNLFSRFRKIQSIYIPNKKSKLSGNKFGFVRMGSPQEAIRAIKEMNGLWIWGRTLVANIARFGVQNKREHIQSSINIRTGIMEEKGQGLSRGHGGEMKLLSESKYAKDLPYNKLRDESKNRAQVWRKKEATTDQMNQGNTWESGNFPTVKVNEVGNGWLYRSAIAKISSTSSIVRIQDQLRNLGQVHVLVRHMGGDMVVLTFKDLEERESMFNEGKMAWLREWFVESSRWENTKLNPCSRLVWLNCYGIPLHLWNFQTFSEIGKIWGEVIMLAEETLKNLSFAVGKILISTTVMDLINKVVGLDNNGSSFQIRVMEEQLVVNTVLRTDCACPGCQVEVPTLNQNLAEESVQSTSKRVNGSDTISKIPLIEDVAEAINYPLQVVPSMVGPSPTKADKTSCLVNINSMQLVPFTGSRGYEHTARSSRTLKMATVLSPQKKGTPRALKDFIQDSSLPSSSNAMDEKPKRKQRSIEDILGLSKPTKTKKGGRRGKQKCVVFRSAMAAAALSVSTEGITNKNRILISESKAAWSVTKILRTDYMGNDEEVISRIMVTGSMKILSLNVRGLGKREKRSKVKKLLSNLKVDMLLLQETKLKDLKPIILQSIWGISEVDFVHVDADGSAGGLIGSAGGPPF
ncbi:uncharacterized protein LOC130761391 [Actinidia eriantha]|uniref:uncharacterized protein LOC130761391 n=1 Tax=Actinidia eriantha TaxID=165200 RepID=UPI0025911E1D|nr:uncharacterized protein LOC130761391 [Actinidia eriantha]